MIETKNVDNHLQAIGKKIYQKYTGFRIKQCNFAGNALIWTQQHTIYYRLVEGIIYQFEFELKGWSQS